MKLNESEESTKRRYQEYCNQNQGRGIQLGQI